MIVFIISFAYVAFLCEIFFLIIMRKKLLFINSIFRRTGTSLLQFPEYLCIQISDVTSGHKVKNKNFAYDVFTALLNLYIILLRMKKIRLSQYENHMFSGIEIFLRPDVKVIIFQNKHKNHQHRILRFSIHLVRKDKQIKVIH